VIISSGSSPSCAEPSTDAVTMLRTAFLAWGSTDAITARINEYQRPATNMVTPTSNYHCSVPVSTGSYADSITSGASKLDPMENFRQDLAGSPLSRLEPQRLMRPLSAGRTETGLLNAGRPCRQDCASGSVFKGTLPTTCSTMCRFLGLHAPNYVTIGIRRDVSVACLTGIT
jgi:hypothetical protein